MIFDIFPSEGKDLTKQLAEKITEYVEFQGGNNRIQKYILSPMVIY